MTVFSILNHPCSFVVYYYLYGVFHLCKALFSGFLQLKSKFVDGQNTSKYLDRAPLKTIFTSDRKKNVRTFSFSSKLRHQSYKKAKCIQSGRRQASAAIYRTWNEVYWKQAQPLVQGACKQALRMNSPLAIRKQKTHAESLFAGYGASEELEN